MRRLRLLIAALALVALPSTAHAQRGGDPAYSQWVPINGSRSMTGPLKVMGYASGSEPYTCASPVIGATLFDLTADGLKVCKSSGWAAVGGGAIAFSAITSGTNTTSLHVGTGGSLDATGTGTIDSTMLLTKTWAAPAAIGSGTPAAGTFTTLAAGTGSPFAVTTAGAITGRVSLLLDTATATDDRLTLAPYVGGAARFDGTLSTVDLTGAHAWNLPDVDGTILTTGNPPTSVSGNAGSATYASAATIADDTTTNATMYPLWATAVTGNLALKGSSTKLTFNPSTGALSTTSLTLGGALSGATTGAFSSGVQAAGIIRSTAATAGVAAGLGAEVLLNGTTGTFVTFNRTSSAYSDTRLDGSTSGLAVGGTDTVTASSTAVTIGKPTTVNKNNILTAQTSGLILSNSTASDVSNTVQNSPSLSLFGTAWKSTAPAASQVNYGILQFVPVSGASSTSGVFQFSLAAAGGAPVIFADLYGNTTSVLFGPNLASGGIQANTGTLNAGFGYQVLHSLVGGSSNTSAGESSGYFISSGTDNSTFGAHAGATTSNLSSVIGASVYGSHSDVTNATDHYSGAFGYYAKATAARQLVLGGWDGSNGGFTSVYIGRGVTTAAPQNVLLSISGGRSGTDTDTAGATFTLAGSLGTGAGAGGAIALQTSTILASGTTVQVPVSRLTISGGAVTTGVATATFAQTHLASSQTTAPTTTLTSTTLNDGAGSGAALTITAGGTDNRFTLTITPGNGVPTAGIAGQVVFNSAFAVAPTFVCMPLDTGGWARGLYVSAKAVGSITLSADVAFVSGQPHVFDCVGLE